ncbi:restriction endonuclease [Micrococcus luteus]|uniref:Restriction endonuclease type IV Mrr domain-containing protein n=1 Tax=Micrococcus luteus TaxID=1270 RepID=A0AAX0VKY9_MICLU|nr:restriction endonuclease [Micrococcus luteus]PKZ81990.1 hypothetical protein CYJ95_07250 [Micrococcus luteus]
MSAQIEAGDSILTEHGPVEVIAPQPAGLLIRAAGGQETLISHAEVIPRRFEGGKITGVMASLHPLWDQLDENVRQDALFKLECVNEVNTGYRHGAASLALEGEPFYPFGPGWKASPRAKYQAMARLVSLEKRADRVLMRRVYDGEVQRPVATPADHAATEVTDPETAPTVVAIRDRIRAHVAGEFREHELTHLVAEILTVLGFRCEVSPPGPDGGVDIIAGTGPLGLDAPTLIVEVKSEPTPIGSRVLRGLHSAMTQHRADQALLVAWGGVTRPAELEFKRDRTTMRIWDADALLDQLFLTYDRLPASTRARIPLQQVWVLEDEG